MKILVFLHGTTIMHATALDRTREERVAQVRDRDPSVHDYASYLPVGNAPEKLRAWERQGAEMAYMSSHRKPEDVAHDQAVLRRYGFPRGLMLYRQAEETYGDTAARVLPDVLIEDDCESIGGAREMVSSHIRPDLQARIHSIVIPEFGGIDHLPDDITALSSY